MKTLLTALALTIFASNAWSNLISPDSSMVCICENTWEIKIDYYNDGHPQGPGGLTSIAQIDEWGKFPMTVKLYGKSLKLTGNSSGQSRLEAHELILLPYMGQLKTRKRLPLGNYSKWKTLEVYCITD